jgi:hypothetical protein
VMVQLGMRHVELGMSEELGIFVFDIFAKEVKKIPGSPATKEKSNHLTRTHPHFSPL